jgi:HAMP domain-containing protein
MKELGFAAQNSCSLTDCAGEKSDPGQRNPTCRALQTVMRGHGIYQSLAVYDTDWSILVTTTETKDTVMPPPPDSLKHRFSQATGFTSGPPIFINGSAIVPLCQPTFDEEGNILTYILGYLDIKRSLDRILGKSSDIGETGHFFLLADDGTYIWTPDSMEHLIGTRAIIPEPLYLGPYKQVTHYPDRDGTRVLGITALIEDDFSWLLLAQIDEDEAYEVLSTRVMVGVVTGSLMLILIALASIRLSKRLSQPLRELARVAHHISSGNMQERAPEFAEEETHEVGLAFNTMVDRLSASRRALSSSTALADIGEPLLN